MLVFLLLFEYVLFRFNSTTTFFGFLIGPVCMMLTVSGFAMRFFKEIEKEPGAIRENQSQDEDPGSKGGNI